MANKELEEKVKKEIEKGKRIIGDESIKESYQPAEDSLDPDNPPGGGSGVPEKDDDSGS